MSQFSPLFMAGVRLIVSVPLRQGSPLILHSPVPFVFRFDFEFVLPSCPVKGVELSVVYLYFSLKRRQVKEYGSFEGTASAW